MSTARKTHTPPIVWDADRLQRLTAALQANGQIGDNDVIGTFAIDPRGVITTQRFTPDTTYDE